MYLINDRAPSQKSGGIFILIKYHSDFIFYAADSLEALKDLSRLKAYLKSKGAIWVVSLKGKQARIKDTDVWPQTSCRMVP